MKTPLITLGGTSKSVLIDQYSEARNSIYKALKDLAWPHPRDYANFSDYQEATERVKEIQKILTGLYDEFQEIIFAISNQEWEL